MASLSSPVERERVRTLNDAHANTKGSHVVYWMNNSVRVRHNPALEEAAHMAASMEQALRVIYLMDVTAQDNQPLPERHASFLLQGLADVAASLQQRKVPFVVLSPEAEADVAIPAMAKDASAVVTDASYLRPGIATRKRAARALQVPLVVVEADVVVPVETATNKAEHAARTIRPKINRLRDDFLEPLEQVALPYQEQGDGKWDVTDDWVQDGRKTEGRIDPVDVKKHDDVLASLQGLDRGAPLVSAFKGGEKEAQEVLKAFLKERLREYGPGRNEPSKQLQSDLSPYLRAGNISPVDIALQTLDFAKGKKSGMKESLDSFLEELIVRRELAANACWFNPDKYDAYEHIVPSFARASLELHKADKRPTTYTYEELEAGLTHDDYWNAAQLEMVVRGKQHGYMRMYWVKQIIGWVDDPAVAMNYGLRLNNRWELDAVDPNSYAGVIWCFGLHDQGWKERPIWGKVRYMNDAGLKRKFNMAAYVAMVDRLIAEQGLPAHIAALRKARGADRRQKTIDQTMKRKRKTPAAPSNKAAKESLLRSIKRLKE